MAATAISAAIRPYSMAVAPFLLRTILRMKLMSGLLLVLRSSSRADVHFGWAVCHLYGVEVIKKFKRKGLSVVEDVFGNAVPHRRRAGRDQAQAGDHRQHDQGQDQAVLDRRRPAPVPDQPPNLAHGPPPPCRFR